MHSSPGDSNPHHSDHFLLDRRGPAMKYQTLDDLFPPLRLLQKKTRVHTVRSALFDSLYIVTIQGVQNMYAYIYACNTVRRSSTVDPFSQVKMPYSPPSPEKK